MLVVVSFVKAKMRTMSRCNTFELSRKFKKSLPVDAKNAPFSLEYLLFIKFHCYFTASSPALYATFASKFLLQRMIRVQILNTNSVTCLIL